VIDIGVLVSGRGSNLQAIMDEIESGRLDAVIKVVISDNPGARALERARACSIPVKVIERGPYPTRDAFDMEIVKTLKDLGVVLVVLAGFMRILSPAFIRAFPMRVINIHPSLLPSFPGLDVHKKTLEHGVKFSGCTVHFVDEVLDSGPIIIQAVVPVLDDDTVDTLSSRILAEEHRIYPRAIQLISEGRLSKVGRRVLIKDDAGG
jgi:phosphoribosylglycinamide formyltransferase-1